MGQTQFLLNSLVVTEQEHASELEKFVKDLLPVIDSIEKAIESFSEINRRHRQGVEMTLDMQLSALNKSGIKVIDPNGEHFNPQYHSAITIVLANNIAQNLVIKVIQKGYLLNERLIRPAMVVVSMGRVR